MRVLTPRQLNRALLARQLLLERASIPIPKVLEQMGCLQAQYAPSMYVGLWSRIDGFRREQLTGLLEQRAVVQGTLMRVTIHLVSARDYWPLADGVRGPRREWYERVNTQGLPPGEMAAAAERVRAARSVPRFVWAFPALMYLSVVFLVIETPRYRTPIDPFIVLLAALALVSLGRRAARR